METETLLGVLEMNPWFVGIAAGVAGLVTGKVHRSRTAGMMIAAASVALGAVLIIFNYNDAMRAALGEAPLETSRCTHMGPSRSSRGPVDGSQTRSYNRDVPSFCTTPWPPTGRRATQIT